jgi:hypothetical protein
LVKGKGKTQIKPMFRMNNQDQLLPSLIWNFYKTRGFTVVAGAADRKDYLSIGYAQQCSRFFPGGFYIDYGLP